VHEQPSVAAWAALVGLVLLIGAGAWLTSRTRGPDESRDAEESRSTRASVRRWAPVAGLVAGVPLGIAIITGEPWQTIAWWALAVVPGAMVTLLLTATVVLITVRRREWLPRVPPSQRWAARGMVALLVGAMLAVPAESAGLVALGVELPLAVALALALGYVLWHGVRLGVRRL
jgi:hypothetical protein